MSNQNKKTSPMDSNSLKQEEKLQSIILLDSYSNKFEPLSSTKPECLLPLIGDRCLLDASIDFLVENEVRELVLFCTRHHAQIKSYVDSKQWHKHFEIHFLYNFKCQSVGDAMREIDAKGVVRSNFILLTASAVITNIKLSGHLEAHKQTCKTDKNAVMSMICLNKTTALSSLANSSNITVFIHNINNRILHYEHVAAPKQQQQNSQVSAKCITIPTPLLENAYGSISKQSNALSQQAVDAANAKFKLQNQTLLHRSLPAASGYHGGNADTILHLKTVQQRNDLLETQIYLCNPYVLHIFTDNFDYDTMTDFVHGVLANEEVSGYTIYIDVFARKFGSHFSLVNDLNSYYLETMRLLQRDDVVLDFLARANYRRMLDRIHVYLGKTNVKFGNNTVFSRNVFVEANCRIGENCELINCYIGSNCVIGNNVKLANIIAWPNTRIGNGCIINSALIGANVRIGDNCSICENTLLANDCSIKDNTKITERAVYVRRPDAFNSMASGRKSEQSIKELSKNFESLDLSTCFHVKEDTYVKYILSGKGFAAEDDENDDDEFGSIEGDEGNYQHVDEDDEEEAPSTHGENEIEVNDTSKNNHFNVIQLRSVKTSGKSLISKSFQKQLSYVSDVDSELDDDESHASSSDEDSDEDEDDDEVDDDENDFVGGDDSEEEYAASKKDCKKSKVNTGHEEDTEIFYKEVLELLKSGIRENLDPANIILEINSRKHANGVQIDDLCYYFAKAILYLPIYLFNVASGAQFNYFESIKPLLIKQIPLFENYYKKTRQSQRIFLNGLLDFFVETKLTATSSTNSFADSYLVKTIHYMFNECEFLSDEVIIEWYEKQHVANDASTQADHVEVKKFALNKLKPFIEWLKEDEDEDDDEDED